MIFKYAIRNKLISNNPREGTIIPKKPNTVKQLEEDSLSERYFESEELELFLKTTLSVRLDLDVERFYLLVFSGMCPGKLSALKKSDLDFENNNMR